MENKELEVVEINDSVEEVIKEEATITNIINNIVEMDRTDIDFDGVKIYGDKESVSKFMEAYSKFFADVENPKNTKVNVFLKNKYAPLDSVLNAVRKAMSPHGLSFIQNTSEVDGRIKVDTLLMHSGGGYMSIEGISMKPPSPKAQDIGSVMTYIRRYTISAICGISSEEDDDGNDASGKKTESPSKEDFSKLNLKTMQAKITVLAKEKIQTSDQKTVTALVDKHLGKGNKVSKATSADKDKLIELYEELQNI